MSSLTRHVGSRMDAGFAMRRDGTLIPQGRLSDDTVDRITSGRDQESAGVSMIYYRMAGWAVIAVAAGIGFLIASQWVPA